MRIAWHGHSCFELDDGNVTIVVDPHDGRSLGIKPPSVVSDYVLMTHDHPDHSASKVIRGEHIDIMSHEGAFSCDSVEVEGFRTFHDNENGNRFGINTIYLFKADGMSICHCGDLGTVPSPEIISKLKGCDVLIVPAGEVNTLDLMDLMRLIYSTSPKVVIPMHYHVSGLSLPLRTLERFLSMAGDTINYVGQEIDISKDELPVSCEYWIFSR